MKHRPAHPSGRRGSITPLMALLVVPLIAMMAFAVDIGWMDLTQADLQNAADAAALAGADRLMGDSKNLNGYVEYSLPGQTNQAAILNTAMANARQAAKAYAAANGAGGLASLALNDADIEFGFLDAQGTYTAKPAYAGFPNTVKVTLRRDDQANGPLGLFFAPVLGTRTMNLSAQAAATIYTATIDSFNKNPNKPVRILPMTYDVNHWHNFLNTGQSPDGKVATGANGAPQLQVYPSLKFPGNFGLLSFDQANDGSSTLGGWIDNGVPASDLQREFSAGLLPLSAHDPSKWDWSGASGLKTSDIHSLEIHVGDTYLLPLFKPSNPGPNNYAAGVGTGSNYYYNIVEFVGVTITYVDNKSVYVQPTDVIDPNAVFDPSTVTPAGTTSSLVTTFTAPKLTR